MQLNLRKIVQVNVSLLIIAVLVVIFELISMNKQWAASEVLDEKIQSEMLEIKAQKIERSIGHVYQNLRLLSLLPAIRNFQGRNVPKEIDAKFEAKYLDNNLRDSIQQVYNNLGSNIAVSEIYGVLKDFKPEKSEKPFFMFDEFILQEKKDAVEEENEVKNADIPEEVEDEEYSWFVKQLQSFEKNNATFNFSSLDEIPLAISPWLRTCDNAQYTSISHGNPQDASGISLVVPFYDDDNKFKGMIVAVLRWNVLEAILADIPAVLVTDEDKSNATKRGISLTHSPSLFVVDTGARILYDRENKTIQGTFLKEKVLFNNLTLKLPGNISWTVAQEKFTRIEKQGLIQILSLSIIGGIIICIAIASILWISNSLKKLADELKESSKLLNNSSEGLVKNSSDLAGSISAQAAAVQETSSSMHEITSMTQSNTESSKTSEKLSESSFSAANAGKAAVQEVSSSIDRISGVNTKFEKVMDQTNARISEIEKIIADIESKAKIINDIVFQTKLLSFNASVEAARAGEHGKGFSVVAEEVGNLANMSGNAAKEISDILDKSKKLVDEIVRNSRDDVERIVSESTDCLVEGKNNAQKCSETLDQVVIQVNQVRQSISVIAKASIEQLTGIREIESAILSVDQSNQFNSEIAEKNKNSADEISLQADQLDKVNQLLNQLIG